MNRVLSKNQLYGDSANFKYSYVCLGGIVLT